MKTTTTSASFAQFIERNSDRSKVAKLLHLHINSKATPASRITTDALDYITNRSNGTISYLPKGREHVTTDAGTWAREGRQEAKPARVITRLLSPAALRLLSERDLEVFQNLYRATFDELQGYRYDIVSGSAIADVYGMSEDTDHQPHSRIHSCMQGHRRASARFAMYVNNPSVIRLLAVTDSAGNLVARALVWQVGATQYLDRIYGVSEQMIEKVSQWAQERGIWVRCSQSSHGDPRKYTDPQGKLHVVTLKVALDLSQVDEWPYMDTFCYLDEETNTLHNNCDQRHNLRLQDTGGDAAAVVQTIHGSYEDENECVYSEYSGGFICANDSVCIGGEYYHEDDVTRTTACRVGGELYPEDDVETGIDAWVLPDGEIVEA